MKRRQRNKTEYTEADSSLRDVAEDISVLDAEFDMEDMDFYIEDLVNDSFPTHFPDTPASSSSRQGRRGDKSSLAETQILQDTLINNHDALLPFLDSTINAWDNNAPTMNAKLGPGEHTGPDFDFPMCDLFQAALPLQDSQSSRNREEGQIPTQDMQGNTLITSSSEGYNTSGAKTIHRNTVILEDVHPETLNTIMGTLLESKTKVKITFN